MLDDPTAVMPSFDVDQPGSYVAQLVVSDGLLNSAADTVTVSTLNSAPVADAGPAQTVYVGDTVTLDGSASGDADGDPLTFSWSLISVPAGSAAMLDDPAAVMPSFDVDMPGSYVAQLIVNDGLTGSKPASTSITASDATAGSLYIQRVQWHAKRHTLVVKGGGAKSREVVEIWDADADLKLGWGYAKGKKGQWRVQTRGVKQAPRRIEARWRNETAALDVPTR
jgi:hypothetical protein